MENHPRVDAANQVKRAFISNVVIGSIHDKEEAMRLSGFNVKGQSTTNTDESDDEGDNEGLDEGVDDGISGIIPGRVFTVTKDYTELASRQSVMYNILKEKISNL